MNNFENTSNKNTKSPILFSILITLLILIFPIVSGTLAYVFELKELEGRLLQTLAFVIAGIIGCIIGKTKFGNLKNIGLKKSEISNYKDYLWFLPLIFIEVLPLFFGIKKTLNIPIIITYIIFTMAVGFSEEIYFRGIIAKTLKRKSIVFAILMSSFLFSIGHASNLLAGASIVDTILQIVFAFIFGVVAVEISFSTDSLVIPILWHTLHNLISLITIRNEGEWPFIIGIIQGFILAIYGIFLWKKLYSAAKKR